MAFIRSKTVGGKKYYQLVRNYRDAGRHRQEVLCHLGRSDSIEAAIAEVSREEARLREEKSEHRRTAEEMEIDIPTIFNMKFGTKLPTRSEANERRRAVSERYRDWLEQPYSEERADVIGSCWEESRFLGEVAVYHQELWYAEWYEEQADASRARLEKLRKCQKEYG